MQQKYLGKGINSLGSCYIVIFEHENTNYTNAGYP